jgi:hypothetical protein
LKSEINKTTDENEDISDNLQNSNNSISDEHSLVISTPSEISNESQSPFFLSNLNQNKSVSIRNFFFESLNKSVKQYPISYIIYHVLDKPLAQYEINLHKVIYYLSKFNEIIGFSFCFF